MDDILTYFKNKKNLINLLVFLVLILALPLGIQLIRQQQIFSSRATAPAIKFSGPNVETRAGKQVFKLNSEGKPVVGIELVSHLGPPAGTTQAPTRQAEGGLVETVYAGHFGLTPGSGEIRRFCEGSVLVEEWDDGSHNFVQDCADSSLECSDYYGGCVAPKVPPTFPVFPPPPPSAQCDSDDDFSQFAGCNSSQCGGEIWLCPATGATKNFFNGGGDCAQQGGPNPACGSASTPCDSDDDYSIFLGCNLNQCGLETWQCPITGATKNFSNPNGDCAQPGGPNPACGDGGPDVCPGYDKECWDAADNQGTQHCSPGITQSDGSCGEDPYVSTSCSVCQVNTPPSPGQCSLSASSTNIQTGQSITWTIKANPIGNEAVWGGTNNGGTISQPVLGYPNKSDGWAETYTYKEGGNYTRNVNIGYPDGSKCQTNTVNVTITGSPIGTTPSVSVVTIPVSSQQKPFPPGSKQTATVSFKDAGHVDTYYIGPLAGTGGSTTSSQCTPAEPCVRECQLLYSAPAGKDTPALVAKDDKTGKPLLDDGCWQDFNGSAIKLRDNTWSRDPLSQCKPWTCTNFDPKVHFDPKSDPRYSNYFNVQGVSTGQAPVPSGTGQVLQASTTAGGSTRVKTLSSGESGKQFEWTAPTQPGKYNFVANAHKITFDKSNNHNSDWDQRSPYNDIGCAWDGFVHKFDPDTNNVVKTNQACSNAGPKEFWVGTSTQSPGPVPPGPVRSPSPGPVRSPSPGPGRSPSPGPGVPTTRAYKIAEDRAALRDAPEEPYTQEPMLRNWEFTDKTPGKKFIFVEFIDSNGKRGGCGLNLNDPCQASIDLLGPPPQITSCRLDTTGNAFILSGSNFGSAQGTLKKGQGALGIKEWTDKKVVGTGQLESEGFRVSLETADGQQGEGACSGISQLALGLRLFCQPQPPKDRGEIKLVLVEKTAGARPVRETVKVDKNGIVLGIKTKLEEGLKYAISLRASNGLRKTEEFTAESGTTNLSNLILPLGDIFPVGGDGVINSLDKSELNRQWVIGASAKGRLGDLNLDDRVNSCDWAWMRLDFGKRDDPEPTQGSGERVCAQVITRACSPENPNDCKDFPTPCDVPEGWNIVQ